MNITKEELNRIENTLGTGTNAYYVYALCRNSVPFYIGKGYGKRFLNHQIDAVFAQEVVDSDDSLTEPEKQARISEMTAKIQTIIKHKDEIEPVIIKWGLTENEAFMCESSLINMLQYCKGRKLSELTNIVNGHASKLEGNSASDIKTKARTLPLFLKECAFSTKDISELHEKDEVVLIKINSSYHECFNHDGLPDDNKIMNCVSGTWRIDRKKWQDKKKYVFALYKGRVVGIYRIKRISDSLAKEFQKNKCLQNFPTYPETARKIDKMVAKYETITNAKKELSKADYDMFYEALKNGVDLKSKQKRTPEGVLSYWRTHSYFVLEDKNVPPEVQSFLNTFVTLGGSDRFVRCETPVQFNF